MIWVLRVVFLLQVLVGLSLSRGLLGARPLGVASGEGDIHMLLGLIAAILTLVAIRPNGADGFGWLARLFPLVPLALGLAIRFAGAGSLPIVSLHIVVGIATIGLVEMTFARARRMATA